MKISQFGGLTSIVGDQDIEQPDRRPRRDVICDRSFAIARIIRGRVLPASLRDDQYAQAELRHDLRRFGTHTRRIETILRMRDRPWADLDLWNLVVLAVERKTGLRQALTDDDRALHEAVARLLHVDAETVVFDRRRAAAEAKDRPAA